jgi:hypothetical protein
VIATPNADSPTVKPTRPAGESATKVPTDELRETLEWLALNADRSFRTVAAAFVPGFAESTWDEYAQAIQDLWDLNTGADPYLFSDANPKLFSPADVRAFEIDQREERRDTALAALLDAITREAP